MSLPAAVHVPKPETPKLFSLLPTSLFTFSTPHSLSRSQTLIVSRKSFTLSTSSSRSSSFQFSPQHQQQQEIDFHDEDEEHVVGDCVVFEEGIFEDPFLQPNFDSDANFPKKNTESSSVQVNTQDLIPEKWKEVQAQINITKKERRKIAQELEFGRLRNFRILVTKTDENDVGKSRDGSKSSSRVAPRNPKLAVYGATLDDISDFFSTNYDPKAAKNPQGPRKLFTKEEKVLLNRRIPEVLAATSDGLTALHKAMLSKKQAICNYLLRESANPFVRDKDGATLMHYAVRMASSQMIKILLLYNVDINLQDNDGWTPLHLAVQTSRTDIVRLLLIKGADKTLKNQDGLTALDLCLYSGHDTRTYELIKLLKQLPKLR
ncbi:hypothetical protein HYC85_005309 [Camellia sinensis]|uniref:Ankyrin repeat domain-containing protein, chloroplastic n=1 Tax=Camellia sinensis TaxID=4442 RepID=A0A7J7I109_CAMSI|nr:hypothetical protein HYC85_005309 [Camellia sinensis]